MLLSLYKRKVREADERLLPRIVEGSYEEVKRPIREPSVEMIRPRRDEDITIPRTAL